MNCNKLLYLFILLMLLACSSKKESLNEQRAILGCRGNYDCPKTTKCHGTWEQKSQGLGQCKDIYNP